MTNLEIGDLVKIISIDEPDFVFFKMQHVSPKVRKNGVTKHGFTLDVHESIIKNNQQYPRGKVWFELFSVMTLIELNADKTRAKLLTEDGQAGWLNSAFIVRAS